MSAYLDTSILLPTLIAEPMTEAVYDYLGADRQELLISDFAAAEVASALSRLVRMALLTEADASARLADFDAWRAAMSCRSISGQAMLGSPTFMYGASIWRCERRTRCISLLPGALMPPSSPSIGVWRPPPGNWVSPSMS